MRILAVIPACEGSVSLPNKNMRVLHGKPMIYYVIRNALRSKYITDIIVTTNSNEIVSLARQMKVMTRLRGQELCNSEVSIDAVVYDVFKQLNIADYDHVVTMQSISPTLRPETLDDALKTYLENDLDTLISVKNQPQFYWQRQSGKPVPMQNERMNRHLLPPFYIETGAFMITRSRFIREEHRIGENVELYELVGDEAIDVNSFGDLWQAENAMSRRATAIFVNGNSKIGLGHISRVTQIADELFTKPDIYYDKNKTDPTVFGDTKYQLMPVDGSSDFLRHMALKRYDVIICDILNTSEEFMSKLRQTAPESRLINFEDDGDGARYADVVINALYEESALKNVRVGSKYYIIPKLFLIYEPVAIKSVVRKALISFGGADPQGYTDKLLELATRPEYSHIHFYAILGKAKKNVQLLQSYSIYPNITVLHDVDNMPEIMSECDVAFSSRGRTCFELAALGIPTLSIAQHSREEKHSFVCEENGFFCLPPAPNDEQLESSFRTLACSNAEQRTLLQARMLSNDLRNGRKNVTELIYTI